MSIFMFNAASKCELILFTELRVNNKKTTKNESYYLRGKIVALVNLLHYHRGQEGEDEIMSGFIWLFI